MRLMPASSAACWKFANERVYGCDRSPRDVNGTFVPIKSLKTVAAPPLKVLWPDVYVGNGGVTRSGVQVLSAVVAGLLSRSAFWIAVIGRQVLSANFASQAAMAQSASAMLSSAN